MLFGFSLELGDFLHILTSILTLGASRIDLASIWCCKVESGWILAGLGSICRRIGVYFSCIFEWIELGFCKQSLYEQYALIVALSIAFLLSR